MTGTEGRACQRASQWLWSGGQGTAHGAWQWLCAPVPGHCVPAEGAGTGLQVRSGERAAERSQGTVGKTAFKQTPRVLTWRQSAGEAVTAFPSWSVVWAHSHPCATPP